MSGAGSSERSFWTYWLGGLLLFALMVVLNQFLVPVGIVEHQLASDAAAVDAIQRGWADNGMLALARFSMVIDLIFIGVYSRGAYIGGIIFRGTASALLRRLGALIVIAAILFCVTDYAETICQVIEAMTFRGSDLLASIHSTVQPVKSIAFLVTVIGLLTALVLRRMTAPAG